MSEEIQLDFENQMFIELLADDGMIVLARGLGLEKLFVKFLKLYSDPHHVVLVLNTSPIHQEQYREELLHEHVDHLPQAITNEISIKEREMIYKRGGVVFITSRILVVDLLRGQCPLDRVAGILVWNGHKVTDTSSEAFILRLYRESTKVGFIKAFSDSPEQFMSGFCQLEKIMRNLYLHNLYIWPRFHATVSASLSVHKPEVVELRQQLSTSMIAIQMAVLDIMKSCVTELKTVNPALELDEVTVETCMGKSFDVIIRYQLDPVWNQLSSKTRQLVFDLKTLRTLLYFLTQYDCVTFYHHLDNLRGNKGGVSGRGGNWMFLDRANQLFAKAKERVFGSTNTSQNTLLLEESPKWHLLKMVLEEVRKEIRTREEKNDNDSEIDGGSHGDSCHGNRSGGVLVVVNDERTCYQLKQYLCIGGRGLLEQQFKRFLSRKYPHYNLSSSGGGGVVEVGGAKKRKQTSPRKAFNLKSNEGPSSCQDVEEASTTFSEAQTELQFNEDGQGMRLVAPPTSKEDHTHFKLLSEPLVVLHALESSADQPHQLYRVICDLRPHYVVVYDPDIRSVRQLEVYKASHPSVHLRVYFLLYDSSVEEQRYLTALRREKEAFQQLIKDRANMVLPVNQESGTTSIKDHTHSRQAGGQSTEEKVIIDMREFRSSLPSLLHKRGITIIPITLEVGDYVLSPDVCVERKSVSDLIGSLNSGRLYTQATSLTRHYLRPVLLIEFTENKSFSLQSLSSLQSDISSQSTLSKLVLLTLHFPTLRVLWCSSPHATVELFLELKRDHPQPDPSQAISIGQDLTVTQRSEYNGATQDFILKLPGINTKNYRCVLDGVKDLQELVSLTQDQLEQLLGNSNNASLLYSFLHS